MKGKMLKNFIILIDLINKYFNYEYKDCLYVIKFSEVWNIGKLLDKKDIVIFIFVILYVIIVIGVY